jgi:excisionase family DNA binding protein
MPFPTRETVGPLLKPGEVAAMFGVTVKTLQRWDRAGKLQSIRTLGGHRRYRKSEVLALRNSPAVLDYDDDDDDLAF